MSKMERADLISAREDRIEFTYGECIFEHYLPLLKLLEPQPGEVFWDVGCGGAKPNVIAAIAFPWLKASKGIEFLPKLAKLAEDAVSMTQKLVREANEERPKDDQIELAPLEILTGDLLQCGW